MKKITKNNRKEIKRNIDMCGFGDRTCGICAHAGCCVCGMNEDEFIPASKEEVKKRIDEGRYICDVKIMKAYIGIQGYDDKELV